MTSLILIVLFVGALYAAFLTFRDEWKDRREREVRNFCKNMPNNIKIDLPDSPPDLGMFNCQGKYIWPKKTKPTEDDEWQNSEEHF